MTASSKTPSDKTTSLEREEPRLPHERDESTASGRRAPSEQMRRAAADVESGKKATDRSVEANEAYERHLRTPTPGEERDTET
ncbi:MAG: hypothetical protein ABI364_07375 [Caldimonas sp.]